MNIEEQFISFKIAKELKELGFNEPCMAYVYEADTGNNINHLLFITANAAYNYNNKKLTTSIPLIQQIIAWFDEKGIYINIAYERNEKWSFVIIDTIIYGYDDFYPSRHSATEAAIKKAILILKERKK